ncbi:hypothetical protein R3P38DRAFT_2790990 [Favolaschia claudopus]|uniref:Uncharacterized protein n=1 Tax=Favolaschia claudopus TaxID=2862362 RepID=A0AAW0AIX4_9AGAR
MRNSRLSTSQANIAHTEVYNNITIEYTNNAQFTAGEQADCIRVLKLAIDAGYFSGTSAGHVTSGPANAFNRLRIISGVHPYTVFSNTGTQQPDPAHITIQGFTNGEGRWKTHLWTLPVDATHADAHTTLDTTNKLQFIKT